MEPFCERPGAGLGGHADRSGDAVVQRVHLVELDADHRPVTLSEGLELLLRQSPIGQGREIDLGVDLGLRLLGAHGQYLDDMAVRALVPVAAKAVAVVEEDAGGNTWFDVPHKKILGGVAWRAFLRRHVGQWPQVVTQSRLRLANAEQRACPAAGTDHGVRVLVFAM